MGEKREIKRWRRKGGRDEEKKGRDDKRKKVRNNERR